MQEIDYKWYKEVIFPYDVTNITGTRLTNGNVREEVVIYEDDHFKRVYGDFVRVYGVNLFKHYMNLQIIQKINKGSFGSIYLVMLNKRIYALKIEEHVHYDTFTFRKKIQNEFRVQRVCYDKLCAPKPIEFGFFKKGETMFSCIFMKYITFYNNTIGDILSTNISLPQTFFKMLYYNLITILSAFQKYKISHGDLHFNNLYIQTKTPTHINNMNKNNTKLCILDFGHSSATKSRLKLEILTLYRSTYIQNIRHKNEIRDILVRVGRYFGIDVPVNLGELNKQFNNEIIYR